MPTAKSKAKSKAGTTRRGTRNQRGDDSKSRAQEAHGADRPARVPLNASQKLKLPPGVETQGVVHRWVYDDDAGSVQKYLDAWWEFETHGGKQYTRPNKGGGRMVLMRIDEEYWKEDQALQEQRNIATLRDQSKMETGDYAPNAPDPAQEGSAEFIVQESL